MTTKRIFIESIALKFTDFTHILRANTSMKWMVQCCLKNQQQQKKTTTKKKTVDNQKQTGGRVGGMNVNFIKNKSS